MSDPHRHPDDHPRRAQPLQPDKPGSGHRTDSGDDEPVQTDSTRKAVQQEDAAVDNVRKGYD